MKNVVISDRMFKTTWRRDEVTEKLYLKNFDSLYWSETKMVMYNAGWFKGVCQTLPVHQSSDTELQEMFCHDKGNSESCEEPCQFKSITATSM